MFTELWKLLNTRLNGKTNGLILNRSPYPRNLRTAISAGTIVTGFFLDGMAGQEPYIDGVLINSNNEVQKSQPKDLIGGLQLFNDTYKGSNPQTGSFVPDYRPRSG